jgi:hypothetical protein
VKVVLFCGAWASGRAIGIRPVPIWKSTEAAPTPARLGPWVVPSPFIPWQDEQFVSKISLPAATWLETFVSALLEADGLIRA